MSRHTHIVSRLHFRGKSDSFYGECWCGKDVVLATWYQRPPGGWSRSQWQLLRTAGMAMIDSVFVAQRALRSGNG